MVNRCMLCTTVFLVIILITSLVSPGYADDSSAPLINPLGDMAAYDSVERVDNTSLVLEIPAKDAIRTEEVVGDIWYLRQIGSDNPAQHLKDYTESIGAEILHWTSEVAVFKKDAGNGSVWWCRAGLEGGLDLAVVKTFRLDAGKPTRFTLSTEDRAEVNFYTVNPGGKFRTLTITVPAGELSVYSKQTLTSGAYKRTVNGQWYLDAGRAGRFVLDTIPQERGKCTFKLVSNSAAPAQIGVELTEHECPVPMVAMGEKLGALRIKNVPYGMARIVTRTPFGTIDTQHPEFPDGTGFESGDVTPDGDAFFLMPAGLWQVEVMPLDKEKASALRANLIPVHAGKETVLDWPLAMTSVFGRQGGSGLEINTIKPEGDNVAVTFALHGPDARTINPLPATLAIKEGGVPATLRSVERTHIPLDIVLLLDSSGSMKKQMTSALAATRTFIQTLPDDAVVRVVDFDTKPKLLAGSDKPAVLKGLDSVMADGATCLYDAVRKGLEMLGDAKRPALLVFTDGFDANYNDTGPGSKATQQEALNAAGEAHIPVFTIGFGKGHDRNTLDRLAAISGGRYYAADNPNALAESFAVISANLGNTYTATYKRPTRGRPSDMPVVTCMVDISGSMNTTPDKAGCNYRIDKVRTILHDFFTALPDNVLAQALSFNDDVFIDQVTTSHKPAMLAGLNLLHAGGGTNMIEAVQSALETQAAIPSSKRYMLFITDAALAVQEEDKVLFDTLLARLKDENIYCLWAGIGALDDQPFKHAAALSGGNYILTESPEALTRSFQELIVRIKGAATTSKEVVTAIELTLKHRDPSGRNITYANADQVKLPAVKTDASVAVPASITFSVTDLKERYGPDVSAMVTGDSVPVRDAKISKRIPINVTGRNAAAAISVKEAFFMSRLRGVNPPSSHRFLVLITEMTNILPKQTVTVYPDGSNHPAAWLGNAGATTGRNVEMVPTYLIPDLKRHLFLRWNNKTMTPVSPATWLAEAPLILPGENAVAIAPQTPVSGALVFTVPEENMQQMSLHLFDTNYGHAEIPLVGTMDKGVDRLSRLPAQKPVKLSDAFSLSIREVKDISAVGDQQADPGTCFRVVEADLVSNVQALLDITPAERFSLRLNTRSGAFTVRLHEVTGLLPLGFLAPTMLSPGSNNRIRLAFQIPVETAEEAGQGELFIDVKGGGVVIPLDTRAAKAPGFQPPAGRLTGDGIDLVINALRRFPDTEDTFVADLTLFDAPDGQSTTMADAFILKKKNRAARPAGTPQPTPDFGKSKGLAGFAAGNALVPIGTMPPDSLTDDLIFGITAETVIPDGGSLRGLVIFKLPYEDADPDAWVLTSPFFGELKQPLDTARYDHPQLLVRRTAVAFDVNNAAYLEGLGHAVARLKRQREARQFQRPGRYAPKSRNMDGDGPPTRNVAVPEITAPGLADFTRINDIPALKKRLSAVRYLPSNGEGWQHRFAPQAVLTQKWGSEGDIARMAEIVLARQGLHTTRTDVQLTDQGRARLSARAGLAETSLDKLPALIYRDAPGNTHILVSPFLEPITRLSGLVQKVPPYDISPDAQRLTLTVSLQVVAKKGGRNAVNRDLSDALGGDTDATGIETVHLLSVTPSLPELSRGAVDIGYTVVGYKSGPVVACIFDGADNRVVGSDTLDTGDYRVVGERIEISTPDGALVHAASLTPQEAIVDRFHTLGVNLPDMDPETARSLDRSMQEVHAAEDAPDNLSALKWYTRNLIYRFVCAQTDYENGLARKLDLVVGRTTKPRCIIATVSRPSTEGGLVTSIDLTQTANQVHPGTRAAVVQHRQAADVPEAQAVHAFNIMSGLFASKLEAGILPDGGMGFFDIMAHLPKDTPLLWLTADARYQMQDALRQGGLPADIIARLAETQNTVLLPALPAIIDGTPRWAWLEVNPDNYETIAVLDTGARGAMVERVFNELWKDGLDYITGGLIGVSSSIWSVSAFSLVMDDYNEITKAAKAFALGLAGSLGGSVKVGDFEFTGKPGDSKPTIGYSGTGSSVVNAAGKGKGLLDAVKDPNIDLGGFEGGFKDGVNFYFSRVGG